MLEIWRNWISAFDRAFLTDDWSDAGQYLTDDIAYLVAGVPFGCELRGKDKVLAGFKKSFDNFDRKFDERRWEPVNIKLWEDQAITCLAKGDYSLEGRPPITFAAQGTWFFRDGRICAMTDLYDVTEVNAMETLEWLAEFGEDVDPSYA